jgi:cytochrome P450
VYDSFSIIVGNGLVLSKGDLWKRQRRNLTPLFHFSSLTKMPPIMNKQVFEFMDELRATNQKLVHPTHEFSRLTLRIVIDCVFGGSEFLDANVMSDHWKTVNRALNAYFTFSMLLGPKINNLLPLPFNLTIKKVIMSLSHVFSNEERL